MSGLEYAVNIDLVYYVSIITGVTCAVCFFAGVLLWFWILWQNDPELEARKNFINTIKERVQ